MTNKLALDICRCASERCPSHKECLRYLDSPMTVRYPLSNFYKEDEECPYKITLEQYNES